MTQGNRIASFFLIFSFAIVIFGGTMLATSRTIAIIARTDPTLPHATIEAPLWQFWVPMGIGALVALPAGLTAFDKSSVVLYFPLIAPCLLFFPAETLLGIAIAFSDGVTWTTDWPVFGQIVGMLLSVGLVAAIFDAVNDEIV